MVINSKIIELVYPPQDIDLGPNEKNWKKQALIKQKKMGDVRSSAHQNRNEHFRAQYSCITQRS